MPSVTNPHPAPPQFSTSGLPVWLAAAAFLLFSVSGQAQQTADPSHANPPAQPDTRADIPRSQTPTQSSVPQQLNAHFAGQWTGQLEYRDFSASSPDAPHTRLPTALTMRPSPDGRAVNFAFTYDDGPGKTVHERTILAFTDDTALITSTSSAQNQAFRVEGLDAFRLTGFGTLVLTGPGKESDKPVEIRETLILEPGAFTWRKETRPAGSTGSFLFRDQYTLKLATAAAPPS